MMWGHPTEALSRNASSPWTARSVQASLIGTTTNIKPPIEPPKGYESRISYPDPSFVEYLPGFVLDGCKEYNTTSVPEGQDPLCKPVWSKPVNNYSPACDKHRLTWHLGPYRSWPTYVDVTAWVTFDNSNREAVPKLRWVLGFTNGTKDCTWGTSEFVVGSPPVHGTSMECKAWEAGNNTVRCYTFETMTGYPDQVSDRALIADNLSYFTYRNDGRGHMAR